MADLKISQITTEETAPLDTLWVEGETAAGVSVKVKRSNFLGPAIGARVYHSVNQAITSNITTKLLFDSERFDTNVIHDPATNSSRLTCKTAGKYMIIANFELAHDITGVRISRLLLDNVTIIANVAFNAITATGVGTRVQVSTIYDLAVNQYVEVDIYQDSGVSLNVIAGPNYSPEFTMLRIAP